MKELLALYLRNNYEEFESFNYKMCNEEICMDCGCEDISIPSFFNNNLSDTSFRRLLFSHIDKRE